MKMGSTEKRKKRFFSVFFMLGPEISQAFSSHFIRSRRDESCKLSLRYVQKKNLKELKKR